MNEGHSAFIALERTRRLMEQHNLSFAEARELASASMVFTSHTPVEAGHDYFPPQLMDYYFSGYASRLGISRAEFLGLGRRNPSNENEDFCMTVLALRMSAFRAGNPDHERDQWRSFPFLDFAGDQRALRPVPWSDLARAAG
jgi:starch phosphorylase